MTQEDLDFFNDLFGGKLSEGFGREYNIFACEQAIVISDTLQTKDKIVEFHKAGWDEQKKMVPGLSDDHSGNTFGMACQIAIAYLPITQAKIRDGKIDSILGNDQN